MAAASDSAETSAKVAPVRPRRERVLQIAAEGFATGLSFAAAAGLLVYAGRREVAQDLAQGWLEDQGLSGRLRVERLDADGFSGALVVGPERDPDLAVERIEVDLGLEPAWAGEPLKLSTRAIRLVRPRLKASVGPGGMKFGRLDPVVQDFLQRPKSNEPGPAVLVEDGSVRLDTPYGSLRLRGSAAVDDGRLVRLDGRVRPASLRGEALEAELGESFVRAATRGDRLTGRLRFEPSTLATASVDLQGAAVTLDVDAPYPDGETWAGPVVLTASMAGEGARLGGAALEGVRSQARFEGRVAGELTAPRLTGALTGSGAASRAATTGGEAERITMQASARTLRLALGEDGYDLRADAAATVNARTVTTAGVQASAAKAQLQAPALTLSEAGLVGAVTGQVAAERLSAGGADMARASADVRTDLRLLSGSGPLAIDARAAQVDFDWDGAAAPLSAVRAQLAGPASVSPAGLRWRASGRASAAGALSPEQAAAIADRVPLLGAPDSHREAIVGALDDFAVTASAVSLAIGPDGTRVESRAPVRLTARSGAELALSGAPLLALTGGAGGSATLAFSGGGLPRGTLTLADWRAGGGAFVSDVRVQAAELDAAVARDATVQAAGHVRLGGGRFSFDAAGCIPVTAAEIEFGENDLTAAAAQVCPSGGPLISADPAGYRLQGAFRGAGLDWPVSELRVSGASGTFDLRGDSVGLRDGGFTLASATAQDQAAETRYNPIRLAGRGTLAGRIWRGRFTAATPAGAALGEAQLVHDTRTGVGGLDLAAPAIAFRPDGLQPGQLTPLLAGIADAAQGDASFTGRLDWTGAAEPTSGGRLLIPGLDFRSPAGAVTQIKADVTFTSLAPLITAPDQVVTVNEIDALTPLTRAETKFTLGPDALRLSGTRFNVAGGEVSLEAVTLPLTGAQAYTGVLTVRGVRLGELLQALNLGEQISADAVLDGTLPFEVGPGAVRFRDGALQARGPGRLSINRTALTGVSAEPAAETPVPVNAIQDFAYQAMENLAFSSLSLGVNSLPEGRLGLLFKIAGEHDPAVAEEARVGWLEALRGTAFERRIPLPKGTPVNLTLDTTLNFDELLQAWLNVAQRRASDDAGQTPRSNEVQPPTAREGP